MNAFLAHVNASSTRECIFAYITATPNVWWISFNIFIAPKLFWNVPSTQKVPQDT